MDDEIGRLFEGAPRFLARLDAAGPFTSDAELFAAARAVARQMPEAEQVELLDAHPRLGAPRAVVSALSYAEQGYDRPDRPDPEAATVATRLDQLNDAYEARFGFRYCVFVNGRSHAALLPDLAAALHADRPAELRRGLDAVIDIAMDRRAKLHAR